jgi:hypothetical protein
MSPAPSRGTENEKDPSNNAVASPDNNKVDSSIKNLIKDRDMLINLLCLLFLWIVSTFDYFLINFQLKYIKGNIF